MTFWRSDSAARDALAQVAAISKSQAVIEFNMDGTIITANQNFLDALGYRLEEIKGQAPFDVRAAGGARVRGISRVLGQSQPRTNSRRQNTSGSPRAAAKSGFRPPTIRSSIADGKPCKVIKFATDITAQKLRSMEDAGRIAAIGRAQAVIEFNLDGTIITANENFLQRVGYSLAEIQGKHHSMFVASGERDSSAYREFWASLNRGEFQSAEYKRFGKGGKEVWILASYNPILDDTASPSRW